MALVHGGGVDAAARAWGCRSEDVLDLSTGVYPDPTPERIRGAELAALASLLGRYPDRDGEPARSALAKELAVPRECLLIAAGAQALIEVLFRQSPWRSLSIREPEYGEVRRCAERSGVEVRSLCESDPDTSAELLWITDPHGFTGRTCRLPDVPAAILDESYATLETRRRRGVIEGWIRIGSLTKCFSMPGLPLGYAIAAAPEIARLREQLSPWPAATLAVSLLPRLIGSWPERDRVARLGRQRLTSILRAAGWEVLRSNASFVLGTPGVVGPDFERHRILVRTFPEWPVLAGWIRLGIPADEAGWRRLSNALRERTGSASARVASGREAQHR